MTSQTTTPRYLQSELETLAAAFPHALAHAQSSATAHRLTLRQYTRAADWAMEQEWTDLAVELHQMVEQLEEMAR